MSKSQYITNLMNLSENVSSKPKIVYPKRNDLADELAAIANTKDAVLILGVDDKTRDIVGIPYDRLDRVEAYVREICYDAIKPPLLAHLYRMELPNAIGEKRPILKIEIPRSLFVHQSPGGYFYRQGSSKRQMAPEFLLRLFQQRSQERLIRFEEQAVPDTRLHDLTPQLWQRFTSRSQEAAEIVLLKRNLLTKTDNRFIHASVAGILMCCTHPQRHLPGAFIEAVHYRGTRQDSNYQIDAQSIQGTLDQQIEQAMAFVRRNRQENPQFSERAVFEAIINAVVHRDYSIYGAKIRLFLFDDRLEIYSPGALPYTVTVENIALRQATRNELITSLLAECPITEAEEQVISARKHYIEKRGDGVSIILDESEKLSGKKPVYRVIDDADDTELLLTIYSADFDSEVRGNGDNESRV